MAGMGQWAETPSQINQSSVLKQGTGISGVIGTRDNGMGRNLAPGQTQGDVDEAVVTETYGFTEEETSSQLWGYGIATGTSDHPSWGTEDIDERTDDMNGYPTYGTHPVGRPGGTRIRSINKGSEVAYTSKLVPNDGDGTLYGADFKSDADQPFDAETSDPSQYVMQTSMTQRDKTRAGSQISGTASEYSAPVKTRIPGWRIRNYGGQERHDAMLPKEQEMVIRHFWSRNAGTGNPADMAPNAMYRSTPYQRTPTNDADQGQELSGTPGIDYDQDGPGAGYGFTEEDQTY